MSSAPAVAPFRIPLPPLAALPRFLDAALRAGCERLLALTALNDIYARVTTQSSRAPFCERALAGLGVKTDLPGEDLRRIPSAGPLIVVSNHPFGGLDGIILASILQRVRPDVRLLANYLLRCIPEMNDVCFFVDPFGGPDAPGRNASAMRSAIRWVRGGGALGVFPSGEVSHLRAREGCITDPPWSPTVARLIRATGAPVLPVFFEGRNSPLFQAAGLLHPRLRTALLARELLGKRGRTVRVRIGTTIPFSRMSKYFRAGNDSVAQGSGNEALTDYLRVRTYILKGRLQDGSTEKRANRSTTHEPLIEAVPAELLAAEVDALPASQCLAENAPFRVYQAVAPQIPLMLREIGRLRELTFRAVGEGTGRSFDVDRFDDHYVHLFTWNTETRQVVGGYRLGPTDRILRDRGPSGLYTTTLFRFRRRLLEQIDPALELGRSFVIPEYQRNYSPLMLLWKGIGRYVALNPRYRRLFGAVSISDEYQSTTRQLLMAFLRVHCLDRDLSSLVTPRRPPRSVRFRDADPRCLSTLVSDLADVEELIGEIESDRRGMPILLRQYLKLNAKLLGLNVDPDFGDVVDGLLLVDLTTVARPILTRYFGREAAEAFLAFHGLRTTAQSESVQAGRAL